MGAAAVVAAGLVLVAGCGGDGGKAAGKPPRASHAPSVEPAETVAEPTQDPFPDTPEGDLDRKADKAGWEVSDESASVYVQGMCDSLGYAAGMSPEQWLMAGQVSSPDDGAALKAGVPKLCPKWEATVKRALSGHYERWFSDGTFEVKASPAVGAGAEEVAPGTYRTKGDLDGCYWERSTRGGNIIANSFASAAREITVTIAPSDGLFKAENCGTWKPVT